MSWAAAKLILNHRPIEELHIDAPRLLVHAVASLREVENHLSTGSIGAAVVSLASEFGKLLESMASKDSARVTGYRRLGHLARVLSMKQGSLAARLRAIKSSKKDNQRVTVMTAHASKGCVLRMHGCRQLPLMVPSLRCLPVHARPSVCRQDLLPGLRAEGLADAANAADRQ